MITIRKLVSRDGNGALLRNRVLEKLMMRQKRQGDDDDNAPQPFNGPTQFFLFSIAAALAIYRDTLFVQFVGVVMIWTGIFVIRTQRVAYGVRGRPARGYITGIPAALIGVAAVGFGIYMLMRPEVVAGWGRHSH